MWIPLRNPKFPNNETMEGEVKKSHGRRRAKVNGKISDFDESNWLQVFSRDFWGLFTSTFLTRFEFPRFSYLVLTHFIFPDFSVKINSKPYYYFLVKSLEVKMNMETVFFLLSNHYLDRSQIISIILFLVKSLEVKLYSHWGKNQLFIPKFRRIWCLWLL